MSYKIMKLDVLGENIEYVDVNPENEDVIIFAHGLGCNLHQWEEQIKHFSPNYRVVAFSLQGHGGSSKPIEKESYTLEAYGQVVLSLLDVLDITKVIWIGNSMGGVIGYEVLKKAPLRIQQIITNGTAPALKYNKLTLSLINLMDRGLVKLLGFEGYINIAVKASLKDPNKRKILKDLFMSTKMEAIIASHQLLGNYDYLSVLQDAGCPVTLVITPADKDINKAIQKHKRELEGLSHVQLHVHNEGGHVLNIEKSDQYNELIELLIHK